MSEIETKPTEKQPLDGGLSEAKARIGSIGELVDVLKDMPQLEAPVKHHFSKGVYAREIFMPKGMLVVGKVHKTKHLNIISQGKCKVITSARELDITAPFTFESMAGEQKVVYMLEDVIWTTIHITEETDLDKIEEQVIAKEYNDELINTLIESFGELPCLG